MKLFDLTSGFIAAALILLGNLQSVEKPQVQDKPMVVETKATTQLYVFNNSTSAGANTAGNWIPTSPSEAPPCGQPGDVPCQIELDLTQYTDMADYLATHNFPNDAAVSYGPGIVRKQ